MIVAPLGKCYVVGDVKCRVVCFGSAIVVSGGRVCRV